MASARAGVSAGRVKPVLLLLAGLTLVVDLVLVFVHGSSAGDLVTLAVRVSFLAVGWLILHRYPDHRRGTSPPRHRPRVGRRHRPTLRRRLGRSGGSHGDPPAAALPRRSAAVESLALVRPLVHGDDRRLDRDGRHRVTGHVTGSSEPLLRPVDASADVLVRRVPAQSAGHRRVGLRPVPPVLDSGAHPDSLARCGREGHRRRVLRRAGRHVLLRRP